MDNNMILFSMPIAVQIANVGSEVLRAIRYKNRNMPEVAENFCAKAVQLLEWIKTDPKNKHLTGELDCAIEELIDYFLGNNIFQTTDETLIRYYDSFLDQI